VAGGGSAGHSALIQPSAQRWTRTATRRAGLPDGPSASPCAAPGRCRGCACSWLAFSVHDGARWRWSSTIVSYGGLALGFITSMPQRTAGRDAGGHGHTAVLRLAADRMGGISWSGHAGQSARASWRCAGLGHADWSYGAVARHVGAGGAAFHGLDAVFSGRVARSADRRAGTAVGGTRYSPPRAAWSGRLFSGVLYAGPQPRTSPTRRAPAPPRCVERKRIVGGMLGSGKVGGGYS